MITMIQQLETDMAAATSQQNEEIKVFEDKKTRSGMDEVIEEAKNKFMIHENNLGEQAKNVDRQALDLQGYSGRMWTDQEWDRMWTKCGPNQAAAEEAMSQQRGLQEVHRQAEAGWQAHQQQLDNL